MRKRGILFVSALIVIALGAAALAEMSFEGAGASFPYPVYHQWSQEYFELTGVKVNYQSIGSGGGIARIKSRSVDFGGSDVPLERDELTKFNLIQFPMVVGGVVPVVNLRGVEKGRLKLTPGLLADIFLGKVKRWNDQRIIDINPDLELPDESITPLYRTESSGTTWIFTTYLNRVSGEWRAEVGQGKAVKFPVGEGGKGNEGVAAAVRRQSGSIGYVEFTYAQKNKLKYVLLENSSGKFVAPTQESFMDAAASADWEHTPGYNLILVDQPGKYSWPITGASFILLPKDQKDPDKIKELLKFFDWCYKHGRGTAERLDYVPLPAKVVRLVEKRWESDLLVGGAPVWP